VQPGFHAFIGGKVDPEDAELPIAGEADDVTRAAAACAIRETLEEVGVLIATTDPVAPETVREARTRLLAGSVKFNALARELGLRFDIRHLVFAGRWQTPAFATVRFDTLFFLARVPAGQFPEVHAPELAEGEWVTPAAALERWERGEVSFVAPILWTLRAAASGEGDLAARLARGPELHAHPVRRIEMKWGVVLHPMKTRPLPPADHTNAYFIGESEMVLVDPGSDDPAELRDLFTLADLLAADGRKVRWIVATHHHPDHVGGIAACRERFGAAVAGHPRLAEALKLDRALRDGEMFTLARGAHDWNLKVLHTPGHTRDSISLLHERTRSLFCGDLIPGGGGTVIIDPPDGSMSAYLQSLKRLLREPVETLFPAHGSPQGAASRRVRGLIAHRLEREEKVRVALSKEPRTVEELVAGVYADTPRELWGYAARSLLAHLEKLEAEGRAARDGDRWRA
jgi:glyoxylase-like metal-dependent hydrolase (beta-lactamase superfamily II)/8-oxo-dGTP pyrophosphatase MutT (NUDIX family)